MFNFIKSHLISHPHWALDLMTEYEVTSRSDMYLQHLDCLCDTFKAH